ncbi:MAG: hypothetical protein LBH58_05815 [Tannerellaceae bacterium]|jgi:hypothetical protein|nr:hypothetical protein [Tannerellaceae bacterium]
MNTADKNPKHENEKIEDDDYVVFIPDKDMRVIDHAILKMECARQGFHKIKEGMKPLDDGETASGITQ